MLQKKKKKNPWNVLNAKSVGPQCQCVLSGFCVISRDVTFPPSRKRLNFAEFGESGIPVAQKIVRCDIQELSEKIEKIHCCQYQCVFLNVL